MISQNYFTPLAVVGVVASSLAVTLPYHAFAQSLNRNPERLVTLAHQCIPESHIGDVTLEHIVDRLHNGGTFGDENRIGTIYLDNLRLSSNQNCSELGYSIAHLQGFTNDKNDNSGIYQILKACNPTTSDERWVVETLRDEFTQHGSTSFFHPNVNDYLFKNAGCDVELLEARIEDRTFGDIDFFGFRSN